MKLAGQTPPKNRLSEKKEERVSMLSSEKLQEQGKSEKVVRKLSDLQDVSHVRPHSGEAIQSIIMNENKVNNIEEPT